MSSWKSNEDRQLQCLQQITEILYEIKNHQLRISGDQAQVMDKAIDILNKLYFKLDRIEKLFEKKGVIATPHSVEAPYNHGHII